MSEEVNVEKALRVAKLKKFFLFSLFAYLITIGASVILRESEVLDLVQMTMLALSFTSVIFCSILAFSLYRKVSAALLTLACIFPAINFLVFLAVISKASKFMDQVDFKDDQMNANATETETKN